MNIENALGQVLDLQPRVIYLCGKTCTGKTTFTHLFEKEGYARVELDKIVMESIVIPFNVTPTYEAYVTAYQDVGPPEQVASFIEAAKKDISERLETSPRTVLRGG